MAPRRALKNHTGPMTVSEVARELDIAAETVREWADSGKLPMRRTAGGIRVFERADIERVRRALDRGDAA